MFLSFTEFIGHFHPALVHLPIGILLIALVLQWLSTKEKYQSIKPATAAVLLIGSITALISCLTGYFLSISDDYDTATVNWHMWMAILLTFVSFILFAKEKNPNFGINKKLLSIAVLVLVFVTGHLGGTLTHGSDYFTRPLQNAFSGDSNTAVIKPIANVQEALAYNDIVKPILQTKCYACHNANKQKGGLRMDDSLLLMKGGKDGKIIEPGNAEASEMIKRLMLPIDNDDHMPPREKPQLTEQQVALLHWWISNNSDFTKKVKELQQPEKIKPVLASLQQVTEKKDDQLYYPPTPVEKADDKLLAQLKERNIIVIPVAQNSNYLSVSFFTHPSIDKTDLQLLQQLKKQLVWLNLTNTNITDDAMNSIGGLENLTKLYLSHTGVTDKGVQQIQSLRNLAYLNLVATKVSAQSILSLKQLTALRSIFLYQTNIKKEEWTLLKNTFPKATIDSGGYVVPILQSDTSLVKQQNDYPAK